MRTIKTDRGTATIQKCLPGSYLVRTQADAEVLTVLVYKNDAGFAGRQWESYIFPSNQPLGEGQHPSLRELAEDAISEVAVRADFRRRFPENF